VIWKVRWKQIHSELSKEVGGGGFEKMLGNGGGGGENRVVVSPE